MNWIIEFEDGFRSFMIAPEGLKVGDVLNLGGNEVKRGNVLSLNYIPEGTEVFNVESIPGDGGKFCRTSGTNAKVVSKTDKYALVLLPSSREEECTTPRAILRLPRPSGLWPCQADGAQ